ncbi:MAG: DUF2975 domain-containing protein [Lachnospiraceae bacterium]|nr:DUF2975 domain-containing protein [Lachnospiraceae bacterium]
MEQKSLSNWLKIIILGTGICGLIVYAYLIPVLGQELIAQYPECTHYFYPWLIFLWVSGIPCYIVLFFAFRIAANIGKDKSFSTENANYLKYVSLLAAGDSAFVFIVNIVFLICNINHPGVIMLFLFVIFAGIAISVTSAALSHLVRKAAVLQEESDFTV